MTERDDKPVVGSASQRIDKWLWFARVVKSRTLAASLAVSGHVRVNRARITKASETVTAGDVITVTAHKRVRVLKVLASGSKRGSAPEAARLFDDLTPPAPTRDQTSAAAQPSH
jgi:ribosome-associated heat shock protein Hsp15